MEIGGFSFHGRSELVLKKLIDNSDGSKVGYFDVYYLHETDLIDGRYGTNDEVKADLLLGKFDKYDNVGQAIIEFEEITENGEFYLKYRSIDTTLLTYGG